MKVGFVGTVMVFRQVNANSGVRLGQIDVVQHGDNRFPTQIFTIDVPDSSYCSVLLEVLERTPNPTIRVILWLEVVKGELKNTLLQLVSVNDSVLETIT